MHYAIIFLILALLCGILGFGVIVGTAAGIAKFLFLLFLGLFFVALFPPRWFGP